MRLTHVKLAGFKSFVDPTAIPVPGQLIAVVGPNGCGKSNVIDAVRWVLGESSAKQLRGESMQDVIFNGSTTRKPVSRASVELVFDNSEGRAAGAWSQYAEISIKRMLTRQGESSYFINNLQCRRRDIADLFLGTGVGTRGYAVIEQGMISRIIEARPEELRAFLEEAAGVTKYKERRKETEGRMADTRENLARVDDIRQELDGQLEKLSAQAEVAARFHELKTQLTEKQNLLALQRKLDAEADEARFRAEIASAQSGLENQTARLREVEAAIEQLREAHYSATDVVGAAQTQLADAAATVARLEQKLLHLRETRQRLTQQQQHARQKVDEVGMQQRALHGEREEWQGRRDEAALQHEEAQFGLTEQQDTIPTLEAAYRNAEEQLSIAQLEWSHARQTRQLAEQQLQHLERSLQQTQQRRERLQGELRNLPKPDPIELEEKRLELETLTLALEEGQARVQELDTAIQAAEAQRATQRRELESLRAARAELAARHEALARLQEQAGSDKALAAWLAAHDLAHAPRVFRTLTTTERWETAVEAILRERLNGVIAQTTPEASFAPARQTIVLSGTDAIASDSPLMSLPSLRQQVRSSDPSVDAALSGWLFGVYCADSDVHLIELAWTLPIGALAVAPSGNSASRNALHSYAADSTLSGVVHRERELKEIEQRLAEAGPAVDTAGTALHDTDRQLGEFHAELKHGRQKLEALRHKRGERQVELARLNHSAEQAQTRETALAQELAELDQEHSELALERETIRDEAEAASADLPALETAVESAKLAKVEAEAALDVQRSRLRHAERQSQELAFTR
ncbi:MAG: chromosome segregation protein SMC, partial [Burkholderiales bacterium]|nr:chromosome segregation protein SMC [Burkholderiales bacterium]